MGDATSEPICQPRRLWLRTRVLIAASCLLDTALLGLFALSGALPAWVALAYAGAGLAWCTVFYALAASGIGERFADRNLTLATLVSAVVLPLACIVLAPAATPCFVCVLFVALASLRLPLREAFVVWVGAAVALVIPRDGALAPRTA